ncbi:MAG: methyltransferase domain-containing protein [Nitrospirae bacterium]|nr:methyltransferase domain-containing protein [Nitrospirota bacterium]
MENEKEVERLSIKVDSDKWVEKYIQPLAKNVDSITIIDLGCGPGTIACSVARNYPDSTIYAIDNSKTKIDEIQKNINSYKLNNIYGMLSDAYSLPFNENTFDIVYCRFLLEYLDNPNEILKEMFIVTKTNGTVLIQDLDGQLLWHYPIDNELQNKIVKVVNYLNKTTGFDQFIGRKLYNLFFTSRFYDIDIKIETYHLFAGKIDEFNHKIWDLKLDIAMPKIIEVLGEFEALSFKKQMLEYFLREDTLTYSTLFTVTGKKPCYDNIEL